MRLLALWFAGALPLSFLVGRRLAAAQRSNPDYGDLLRALEEMWRR